MEKLTKRWRKELIAAAMKTVAKQESSRGFPKQERPPQAKAWENNR